jgi:pyruvate/2-oxoglutarate/acetoin dehydrogenase E1 component
VKKLQLYTEAILDATEDRLKKDNSVILIGLGVPDPKGIFGTTLGLQDKFGESRVFDCPISENSITGILIGAAINGFRPILTHQRVEFSLLAVDQMFTQAAKWSYMTAGKQYLPIVIRLIIGRGWGQGPQHSQSLFSVFSHIPGLIIVAPSTPQDAKGLLIASVKNNNPVIFFEHRWLHGIKGNVSQTEYEVPIGKANIYRKGTHITIVSYSYMFIECIKVAEFFEKLSISVELIDLRTLRPLDSRTVIKSVKKTKNLIFVDNDWESYGIGAEIISRVVEVCGDILKSNPTRLGIKEVPIPSTRALARYCYPSVGNIIDKILKQLKIKGVKVPTDLYNLNITNSDIPNSNFKGPF